MQKVTLGNSNVYDLILFSEKNNMKLVISIRKIEDLFL